MSRFSPVNFSKYLLLILTTSAVLFSTPSIAITISDVSTTNFSNSDHYQDDGNSLYREYSSNLDITTVTNNNNDAIINGHLAWFHGMRVDQPEGPNFALIYRHNIGYEITFTVNDPIEEGYEISIEQHMKGLITVSREEAISVSATAGLMLGRVDEHQGDGPIHLAGFSISGGGLSVDSEATDTVQTITIDETDTQNLATQYIGTHTFTMSFSSFPSPALVSIFQNSGGGETSIQFGVTSNQDAFLYGNATQNGLIDLTPLGHFSQINITSLNLTAPDTDNDGVADNIDNCVLTSNPDQLDTDGDGVGDVCDNCMETPNSDQLDTDEDGIGDVCDNCLDTSNPDQLDIDEDGIGDVCDNCMDTSNPDQLDIDEDGIGDVCDNCMDTPNSDQLDIDEDGIGDVCDNCMGTPNSDQLDTDEDGVGDVCDNCVDTSNPDQVDTDDDGIGDMCDNCINTVNPDQLDSNNDGTGDLCEQSDEQVTLIPKKVNCKTLKGNVPMTLLGSIDFNVSSIDILTLDINQVSVAEKHNRLHLSDINNDGYNDAKIHLNKSEFCKAMDTLPAGNPKEFILNGQFGDPSSSFESTNSVFIKK
ncbi:thrombospondin type 3 repeat-containing protein [Pseudoalteromonas denitrificans]|uniref:Thrombospondin type 3 repeat-containing protein n=1 Tax=Pseudoalteromonas denitrificans DSM 6059 TaxID=1123010 RepID=A0A1I1SZK0_9GAMM|nr:Thrombospondin type 3 repeat-containing protein [Pseudoalteromonas denitrificans DSM 6059]